MRFLLFIRGSADWREPDRDCDKAKVTLQERGCKLFILLDIYEYQWTLIPISLRSAFFAFLPSGVLGSVQTRQETPCHVLVQ
jgi:hypothetical protein